MPVTTPTIATPTHTTTPRRTEPQRHAGDRGARDATAVEQAVEADEPARVVRERVGGDDVHHDVDEAAGGHREHEGRHEQHQMRSRRLQPEERAPDHEGARQRPTRAEAVGDGAPDRGDRGRGDDPRREQGAEPGVGEVERALDVDGRHRPSAREDAEHEERDGDRTEGCGHAAVWHGRCAGSMPVPTSSTMMGGAPMPTNRRPA